MYKAQEQEEYKTVERKKSYKLTAVADLLSHHLNTALILTSVQSNFHLETTKCSKVFVLTSLNIDRFSK